MEDIRSSEKMNEEANVQSIMMTSETEINRATVLSILPDNVRSEFDNQDPTRPFKHDIEYYRTLETIFYLRFASHSPSPSPISSPTPYV